MVTTESESETATGPMIRVFGGMGVDDGGEPVSIGGPRQRRLLALLAARAGSVVDIDWLAEYLWDDEERPEVVAATLRTNVSRLRYALPDAAQDWIQTEPGGYRLASPTNAIEHRLFSDLRAQATRARDRGDPLAAKQLLDEALALWRGDPFRELEDLDWGRAEIEQLNLDRLEMLEERWEAALALGRHTQITGELGAFTAEHGLRDRAARQYALALHRSGRTPEALRVLENHRRTVAEETGLDPSPAVLELEQSLLTRDASLDLEADGRPLRGYRLLEQAGTGAFAVVWRGIQPSVDREVAIKEIRADLATQPEFIRRFEAEAHLVARIEHPHIVPLIDFWRDPDSAYLVMRWLRGGTLERRLDDGPLTLQQTLAVAREVGSALSAAHAQGIVHRDVKTANILFDEHGNSFLTDFGIALEAAESAGPEAALSPGSPAYASPEQIRREPLGPAADVFSLGVVIFECLAGTLPFADTPSDELLVERQLREPFPSLDERRGDVPAAVVDAVRRATAKDPSERFASVTDFVAALEAASSADVVAPVVVGDVANPYNGLRAFDDGDVDRFFGRARLVTELVGRLAESTIRSRCLVVVGPSGSGKSSVVRAGLIPALRAGAVPGSDTWFTTTMVPGDDPFEALEAALLRVAVNPPASLLDQLREGDRGILRAVRRCLADDGRLLLVVDQFEETFTRSSPEVAAAFLDGLAVAAEDPGSPLVLVATLRADYYDRPLSHRTFAPLLKETAVDLTPLAPDELEQAIVEPARRVGVELEPGLGAIIAAESLRQPAPLPLLQFAMSELFDRRDGALLTSAAYAEIGGLSGALAARAEALHGTADDAQRAAIRRVLGRLTNPVGEAADLRRRVAITDLGEEPEVAWVLDQFGAARLLTFDRETATREPTVEVAHEAFLREWPRLATWLAADRELLRLVDSASTAADAWDDAGRDPADLYRGARLQGALELVEAAPDRLRTVDTAFIAASQAAAEEERDRERARVRRLRRLVAGVGVALVLALIAGGIALRQQRRADDEADRANAAAAEAEAQTEVAEAQTEVAELATFISRSAATTAEDPVVSLLLALEANRRAPGAETEAAVLDALGRSQLGSVISSFPRLEDPELGCDWALWAADGSTEHLTVGGVLTSRDLSTGATAEHGPAPAPCAGWMADPGTGRRWAMDYEGFRLWFGPLDGEFDVEVEFDRPHIPMSRELTGDRLIIIEAVDFNTVSLVDTTTGEIVGSLQGRGFGGTAVSADGSIIAVSSFSPDAPGAPDGDGRVHILDALSGEVLFHVDVALFPSALVFDDATNELIVATEGGRIVTIDVEARAVVSEVETATTAGWVGVGVRPDGLVVAVSEGQIELVDRRTGATGEAIDLGDGLVGSRIRDDGSVVVGTTGRRIQNYAFGVSALAEQVYAVDPFAAVWVGGDRAIVSGSETIEVVEAVDLATGTRSVVDLPTPADVSFPGEGFGQPYVFDVAGGFVGATLDGRLARWEDGQFVEEVRLGTGPTDLAETLRDRGDQIAVLMAPEAGPLQTSLISVAPGELDVTLTVDTPEAATIAPSADGGLHVMNADGTLVTYDADGSIIDELATGYGRGDVFFRVGVDESSARLAFGGQGATIVVDPTTGQVDEIDGVTGVDSLGFARNGELLVIIGNDGDIRLWDLVRGESAGLLWQGTGSRAGSHPFYDEATESLWVGTSGQVLQFSLRPERWLERACELAGRDLTPEEWDRFVPGDGQPQSACS